MAMTAQSGKERKAKGAMMVALAMMINNLKNLEWVGQGGLTEQDMDTIHKGILSAQWYDVGLWERMGMAVFKLVGKNQPESAYQFGVGILAETLLKVYKGPLQISDPAELLNKIASLYGTSWYNFGSAEFKPTGKGGIFIISHPDGIPIPLCFVPMARGVITRLARESDGKNVKVVCEEEPLLGSQKLTRLTMHISWE